MSYTIGVAGNVMTHTTKPGPSDGPFTQPPCVMLIDDEDETRDMLGGLLGRAGYLVVTASNGVEALDVLRTVRPSLIVLDLQMPLMDGYAFREAQRRAPSLITIPTVVLTGTDFEPMLDPAIAETLRKPVSCSRLLHAIERHCGAQHS